MDTITPQQDIKNEDSLPQEILELVVENLGDDETSLSTFSSISRTFLSAGRIHRFRHLTFANPSHESCLHASKRCLELRNLATETPDLLRYTRHLTLILERPLGSDPNLLWIIEHLGWLTDLRLLSGSVEPRIEWNLLSTELQNAIKTLLHRSPTLYSFAVDGYTGIPLEILHGVTSLKRVLFHKTYWSPELSAVPDPPSQELARPISLKITGYIARGDGQSTVLPLELLKRLFWLEGLVELELPLTEKTEEHFHAIFRKCFRSLQVLSIEFPHTQTFYPRLDLSRLPLLRVLKAEASYSILKSFFRTILTRQVHLYHDEVDVIAASLRTIDPVSSRLESFYFKITSEQAIDKIPLGGLDGFLSHLNAAHPVYVVKISFRCPPTQLGDNPDLEIRTKLPLLNALGILEVDVQSN